MPRDRLQRCGVLLTLLLFTLLAHTASAAGRGEPDPALLDRLVHSMAADYDDTDRFDAEVWLKASDARLSRYLDRAADRLALLQLVYREAQRQGLDPDLVLAVMQVESAFDRFAISSAGAQGLMQVMPFWRLEIGRPQDNLIDAETNVRYGTTILAFYIEEAEGDLVDALARYNGSRGRLKYPELVVGAWRKHWRTRSTAELPELLRGCADYALKACYYR